MKLNIYLIADQKTEGSAPHFPSPNFKDVVVDSVGAVFKICSSSAVFTDLLFVVNSTL